MRARAQVYECIKWCIVQRLCPCALRVCTQDDDDDDATDWQRPVVAMRRTPHACVMSVVCVCINVFGVRGS